MRRAHVFKGLFFVVFTLVLFVSFLVFEPNNATRLCREQDVSGYVVLICLWSLTFVAIFTVVCEVDMVKVGQVFEVLSTCLFSSSLVLLLAILFSPRYGATCCIF